ncbi:MAG: UDP-N-acetylmuramoyl-L-alanyl-D-glutamate--2,6-diaminopimelate ligase [Planctomycetes bacterium]|nr:UDP-N-acetylmuramoyl-L-alanyl-D-glutamate--2,6-diaminopimelate ligase [Planctomycetota bacterium]
MKALGELLAGIVDHAAFAALGAREVSGVFDDSRRVTPGSIFFALRGSKADGRQYVEQALARGALLVVCEGMQECAGRPIVSVPDARKALARVAIRWHELEPVDGRAKLKLLGVTGTNGKTTAAHMTREILRHAGLKCGMFGTVQNDLLTRSVSADMTTPGPIELAAMLAECAAAGGTAVVMEVSSHALDQQRACGLPFCGAAFTNLTQDHLDYHQTMDAYADAKARLFEALDERALAVVNADDPAWQRMVRDTPARVMTYGLSAAAQIRATITRDSLSGTLYRMRIEGRELALENALVGRHNVYNAMAAAGLALAAGVAPAAIEAGLNGVRNVAGRLQRVPGVKGVDVFVDYAHTDDAIRNVAGVLRPLTRGRLIIVFGCGGDRDRNKRPKMARAAAEFADAIIVTSDNPRTEDPDAIIAGILPGFDGTQRRHVVVESDRRKAIFAAMHGARAGDAVLIAGKGHEDYQIIGTTKHHFDDVETAIAAAASCQPREVETATT